MARYNPQSADTDAASPYDLVSTETTSDGELSKMLTKFDADIISTIKLEKESGRMREDGRVRQNIRDRISQILLIAAMQMNSESRTVLLNTFGLKLLGLEEFILAKECFESSLLLTDSITDKTR